jgi:hypothetical protein
VSAVSEPLLPAVDEDSRPFFAAAAQGQLLVQRCTATGRLVFPPRALSPFAPRAPLAWVPVSGRGTIWSFVVAHRRSSLVRRARALRRDAVALDEDPRVRLVETWWRARAARSTRSTRARSASARACACASSASRRDRPAPLAPD